jgi:hypothetical protein
VTDHINEEDLARLRDAMAGLMGRNAELEQRIEILGQERDELGVDEVARSLIQAADLAEAAMADSSALGDQPGIRYVIPELSVEMRGIVGRRGDGLGIRFPGSDEGLGAGALSTISMRVAHVPAAASSADAGFGRLSNGLEAAQASLARWDRDAGRAAAAEIVAQASYLLTLGPRSEDATAVAGIVALAVAIERFQTQAAGTLDPAVRDGAAGSSERLSALARRLDQAGRVAPQDRVAVGTALAEFADALSRPVP